MMDVPTVTIDISLRADDYARLKELAARRGVGEPQLAADSVHGALKAA